MARHKRKLVAILPEVKLTFELRGFFGPHEEACVGSAFDIDGGLQFLVNEVSQEAEQAYKVTLTGTLCANEDVKSSQLKIPQGLDGLETLDGQLFDGVG